MCRLHWGHIVSDNLYNWTEVKTAIAPSEYYDIKGCWSGCVAEDEKIFGQYPGIIYTGVDYGKAMISFASPTDSKPCPSGVVYRIEDDHSLHLYRGEVRIF